MKKFFLIGAVFLSHALFAYLSETPTPFVKYLVPIEITEPFSGLEGVDLVYVINLNDRKDKWNWIRQVLQEQRICPNRVSAVNGWKLSSDEIRELRGPYRRGLTGGQVGCLLSHLSVLKDAYERKASVIWVFEDDALFLGKATEVCSLLKKIEEFDPAWDILYTDSSSRIGDRPLAPGGSVIPRPDQPLEFPSEYYANAKVVTDDFIETHNRYGTYSMLLSSRGIKKLYEYFTHVYLWTAYDNDLHCVPGIRQYSLTRDIVTTLTNSPISSSNTWGKEGLEL